MSEALQLADALERDYHDETLAPRMAAAELRRLVAENEALRGELAEQARVNGMGGEREARLMAELERKSDAIQRLWKERDELRSENRTLVRQNGEWQAINAELAGLIQQIIDSRDEHFIDNCVDGMWGWDERANAALAKVQGEQHE